MRNVTRKGFSLIEVLVAIVIIGVLASTAIPAYSKFITDGRRSDAHHLLRMNAQRLERCFTLEGSYAGSCSLVTNSKEGYYSMTAELSALSYKLTAIATAKNGQDKDIECTAMTLDNIGRVDAAGSLGVGCW